MPQYCHGSHANGIQPSYVETTIQMRCVIARVSQNATLPVEWYKHEQTPKCLLWVNDLTNRVLITIMWDQESLSYTMCRILTGSNKCLLIKAVLKFLKATTLRHPGLTLVYFFWSATFCRRRQYSCNLQRWRFGHQHIRDMKWTVTWKKQGVKMVFHGANTTAMLTLTLQVQRSGGNDNC